MTQQAPSTADAASSARPVAGEYAPAFDRYIGLVPAGDIVRSWASNCPACRPCCSH